MRAWWHPKPREGFRLLFSADPRALGLFRIAFGLLCLVDVARRVRFIDLLYTYEGLVPGSQVLRRTQPRLDLMSAFATEGEVLAFFAVTALCLLAFTAGFKTRVFHVLSAVCVISLHNRNTMVGNGGDCVINLWWVWTFFLPLGRRLSVDALLESLRTRREKSPAPLRAFPAPDRSPAWSLAAFGVALQYAIIYFYNTVQKDTPTWDAGTALGYVLEQDRILTPFGAWFRDAVPFEVTQYLSWGTLTVEGAAVVLLLTPLWTVWARRLGVLSLVGLHLGIWATVDIGLFSWAMLVGFLLLLSPRDIEWLKRPLAWLAGEPIVAHYDSDCGVCHLTARLATRFDRLRRITWYGREDAAPLPPGVADFDVVREGTVVVHAPGSDRVWTKARAIGRIVAALPLGRLVAWVFWLPGVERAYDAFAARRHRVSAWLGMGECGLAFGGTGVEVSEPARARRALGRAGWVFLQIGALVWSSVAVSQALVQNNWSKERLSDFEQPKWARKAVHYTGTQQSWRMFRMTRPHADGWLVIDARLADGRHVDPQSGEPPVFGPADYRMVKSPALWMTLSARLARPRRSKAQSRFGRWLRRTGKQRLMLKPEDEVVSFEAWWIRDRSPDPRVGGDPVETSRKKVFSGGRPPKKKARSR